MPRIRTDDGPRKLRSEWLGPKGWTFPAWLIHPYTWWLAGFVASTLCGLVLLVVFSVVFAPIYGIAAAVLLGIPAGFQIASWLIAGTSFDEPLMYRLRMWREFLRRSERADQGPQRYTISMPPIGGLSDGARRAMR